MKPVNDALLMTERKIGEWCTAYNSDNKITRKKIRQAELMTSDNRRCLMLITNRVATEQNSSKERG